MTIHFFPVRPVYLIGLFLWCIATLSALAQKKELIFKKYTTDDGLSHNWIKDIVQDRKGYIWLATSDGLNRFDGYSFNVYKSVTGNKHSLPENYIRGLHIDKDGMLWILYNGGISRYDHDRDEFVNYANNPNNQHSLGSNNVTSMASDSKGKIWVGTDNGVSVLDKHDYNFINYRSIPGNNKTPSFSSVARVFIDSRDRVWLGSYGNGLDIYDPVSKIFTHHKSNTAQANALTNDCVQTIFEDSKKNIWVGTCGGGVYRYDEVNKNFIRYRLKKESGAMEVITCINEDLSGNIWIGTENDGLFILNTKTAETKLLKNNKYLNTSIAHNSLYAILRDKDNNMWVGTFAGGVSLLPNPDNQFGHIYQDPANLSSLSNNSVLSFCEDSDGNLWLGTDMGGLNLYDPKTNNYKVYKNIPGNPSSLSADAVLYVFEDKRKNIWVGTYNGGLNKFDKRSGTFKKYIHSPGNPFSISGYSVGCMTEDSENNFWLGTWGGGLNLFDREKNTAKIFRHSLEEQNTLSDDFVFYVYEDKRRNLWVCTATGLNLMEDRVSGKFRKFLNDPGNPVSISNNIIYSCFEDSKGRFWVGTGGGLNLMNRDSVSFVAFDEKDGLPNNNIFGIMEDEKGNLWLSGNKGISCFNPDKRIFKNYNKSDGLQSDIFNQKAFLKKKSGEMLWGGVNGFNIFDPATIRANTNLPQVIINELWLFDQKITPSSENSPLTQQISEVQELRLSYDMSNIRFGFVAINFTNTSKNQYAYMLEGFDKEWYYSAGKRTATYTNLDPGTYTFRVKASNNDGVWNTNGTSIKIIITPPFWKTWWFKILCILILLIAAYYVYKLQVSQIERKQAALEAKVKERTSQVEKQKQELELLYNEVEESIEAAMTIQQSLLPSNEVLSDYLHDFFVIYQPKHKVSGDLYWVKSKYGVIYIALVDCTGHGIPGAFLSMIAYDKLNEIISNNIIRSASEMLDELNRLVTDALNGHHENPVGDTMDISFCILDKTKNSIQYAGARIPFYLVRNGELIHTKGDRYPIGTPRKNKETLYTNHSFEIMDGDMLYLSTDGFTDQIGGPENSKFLPGKFRELIVSISDMPVQEQSAKIQRTFQRWKGDNTQLDDITVIGIRL